MLDDPEDPEAMDAALKALGGELMSHNTYDNIVHNKANIDYCIDQFSFVSSRIKCIKMMTGNGPFLA
eukprot:CAMPEP_0196723872 /NCGR_PEP_ID=MMETSP1091-20130531/5929_1 /TAXON_ID=302021 /ORGANISM="Rhodomonas sp., Strain CCMP768" /LENGTH=66 /DNA_ID=CAMNT_0042065913 /DNA_START=75 /DNA_END=275 /DNA_ORIENTATION=+